MKKIVITFGLIAGVIVSTIMVGTLAFMRDSNVAHTNGEIIGYTSMVIAFSMIFFGVKSLRDDHMNGAITFGKALQAGLLITLIGSLAYAITWEFYFNLFEPGFMDQYADAAIEKAKSSGASAEKIESITTQMNNMREWYRNPLIRFGVTLAEIAPIGILFSLIAAAIFRKKNILNNQTTAA